MKEFISSFLSIVVVIIFAYIALFVVFVLQFSALLFKLKEAYDKDMKDMTVDELKEVIS